MSFIQSCVALKLGCTPETVLSHALKLPVVLNLAGYVVGTVLADLLSAVATC